MGLLLGYGGQGTVNHYISLLQPKRIRTLVINNNLLRISSGRYNKVILQVISLRRDLKINIGVQRCVEHAVIRTCFDLKVSSEGNNLKYDFIVAPGADPQQIVVDYQGSDPLWLEEGNVMERVQI